MNEHELRGLIGKVKAGKLSRRGFMQRMTAVGISVPFAAHILAHSGVAIAQSKDTYKPTKAGGGGPLKVLWWQGPTLLNPHFAVGTKDQDGSRLFYEPLGGWDGDGNLRPRWAPEGAVVARADPAEPALRGRHQGPGRLAPVLRAAGRMGRRGQSAAAVGS